MLGGPRSPRPEIVWKIMDFLERNIFHCKFEKCQFMEKNVSLWNIRSFWNLRTFQSFISLYIFITFQIFQIFRLFENCISLFQKFYQKFLTFLQSQNFPDFHNLFGFSRSLVFSEVLNFVRGSFTGFYQKLKKIVFNSLETERPNRGTDRPTW